MTDTVVPFSEYLEKRVRFYRFAAPLIFSSAIGIVAALLILVYSSDSDRMFLETISPHIATLIEAQDRPELQRFIDSISEQKSMSVEVIQSDAVLASSKNYAEIGLPPHQSDSLAFAKSKLTPSFLLTEVVAQRHGGPDTQSTIVG